MSKFPTPKTSSVPFDKVYEPAEDSFLLLDVFELKSERIFLQQQLEKISPALPIITEVGTGSGIVTSFLHNNIIKSGLFLTTDVNPHACSASLKTSSENNGTKYIDSIQNDLTTSIRPGLIDMLIFNPPYVPDEKVPSLECKNDYDWLDLALLGGVDGMEVTNQLLHDLEFILSESGVAYILFCARNKPEIVADIMRIKGWNAKCVITRKAGWEVLSIYRFWR